MHQDSNNNVAIARFEDTNGGDRIMMCTETRGIQLAIAQHVVLDRRIMQVKQTFDQREIDVLDNASLLTVIESRTYRRQTVHSSLLVGHVNTNVWGQAIEATD